MSTNSRFHPIDIKNKCVTSRLLSRLKNMDFQFRWFCIFVGLFGFIYAWSWLPDIPNFMWAMLGSSMIFVIGVFTTDE